MGMISGIDITLYVKTQTGTDNFNAPVYSETAETVSNVLVSPASSADIVNDMQLYGKKAAYTLAIPKGDTHDWCDAKVSFFGQTFKTYGLPIKGIEARIPLDWNMKVMCERYE